MADPNIDTTGGRPPQFDGDINTYESREAVESRHFDAHRTVTFVNGMNNSAADHVESALALSLVQMCKVAGVYNASAGGFQDFLQCVGDKNQFDGPFSFSAATKVTLGSLFGARTTVAAAQRALSRNRAQVALFDHLRKDGNTRQEIFAHSQGNLILSNALQAIAAVGGPGALGGYRVHTYGSPAVNWPRGLAKLEHGFTWDPVTFLAGFDTSWTISKVGMPKGSLNPITHSFLEYLKCDPAFVVNRFRVGGLRITWDMDEEGLAECLAAMGTNTPRVRAVFEHLDARHTSDADDVAVLYVREVRKSPGLTAAVKADKPLVDLLVRIMDEGWTTDDEKAAMAFLQGK